MTEMGDRLDRSLSGFERAMMALPGYGGYKEKELARAADKLIRDHIVQVLSDQLKRLGEFQRRLLDARVIDLLDDVDLALRRLQTLADSVRTATYGYAGVFDAIKVKEAELEQLSQYDASLLDNLEELSGAVDSALEAHADNRREAVARLLDEIETIRRLWRHRREAIVGLVESEERDT